MKHTNDKMKFRAKKLANVNYLTQKIVKKPEPFEIIEFEG